MCVADMAGDFDLCAFLAQFWFRHNCFLHSLNKVYFWCAVCFLQVAFVTIFPV